MNIFSSCVIFIFVIFSFILYASYIERNSKVFFKEFMQHNFKAISLIIAVFIVVNMTMYVILEFIKRQFF